MGSMRTLCAAVAVLLVCGAGWADEAPLGSVDYKPTPQRPIGWRGDGSGRYPGANPPTTWERKVKSFVADMHCQSAKPKDEKSAGVLMTIGDVNEWLIVGPFPRPAPATAASQPAGGKQPADTLEDVKFDSESTFQPDAGEKSNGQEWKVFTASMGNQGGSYGRIYLDFAVAYGMADKIAGQNKPGKIERLMAYAHSYVWSPAAGKAWLRITGGKANVWLNGVPVKLPSQYEASPVVDLKEGWNNLMVKSASSSGDWKIAAQFSPIPPYQYETKNVLWMTQMPGSGWSSPTIVGDRIFVSADMASLVCINKADGKILWIRNNTAFDCLTDQEKAAPELKDIAALSAKLNQITEELVPLLNATAVINGIDPKAEETLRKKLGEKSDLENKIVGGLMKVDPKRFKETRQHCCQSTATPSSDGKYVYAAYLGSGKSDGANTVACYDIDGKKIWAAYLCPVNGAEHGCHSSPLIVGDKLLYGTCGRVTCFDRITGKVAWSGGPSWNEGSPVAAKVGDVDVAFTPAGACMRMNDGTVLWKTGERTGCASPVITDGVVFFNNSGFKIPAGVDGDKVTMTAAFQAAKDDFDVPGGVGFSNSRIGSPLMHDGLVYVFTEGGGLAVYDSAGKQVAYKRVLDALNPRLTWVFNVGVCSSPILGGKCIYITDDQSQTLVMEPGREFKPVARNVFHNLAPGGEQDQFESCPVAEGARLYFRGPHQTWCVGER